MSDPTSEQVIAFWQYMSNRFGSRIVTKRDSGFMRAISNVLQAIGVMDAETFLKQSATTIDGVIYVPFEIGSASDGNGWDLWSQITVCAHEHEHIVQQSKMDRHLFNWRYLTDSDERSLIEAHAYISQIEMDFWRFGEIPDLAFTAGLLRGYGCSDTQVAVAEKLMRQIAQTIGMGAIVNETSRVAIHWLESHAPEIRER